MKCTLYEMCVKPCHLWKITLNLEFEIKTFFITYSTILRQSRDMQITQFIFRVVFVYTSFASLKLFFFMYILITYAQVQWNDLPSYSWSKFHLWCELHLRCVRCILYHLSCHSRHSTQSLDQSLIQTSKTVSRPARILKGVFL